MLGDAASAAVLGNDLKLVFAQFRSVALFPLPRIQMRVHLIFVHDQRTRLGHFARAEEGIARHFAVRHHRVHLLLAQIIDAAVRLEQFDRVEVVFALLHLWKADRPAARCLVPPGLMGEEGHFRGGEAVAQDVEEEEGAVGVVVLIVLVLVVVIALVSSLSICVDLFVPFVVVVAYEYCIKRETHPVLLPDGSAV